MSSKQTSSMNHVAERVRSLALADMSHAYHASNIVQNNSVYAMTGQYPDGNVASPSSNG